MSVVLPFVINIFVNKDSLPDNWIENYFSTTKSASVYFFKNNYLKFWNKPIFIDFVSVHINSEIYYYYKYYKTFYIFEKILILLHKGYLAPNSIFLKKYYHNRIYNLMPGAFKFETITVRLKSYLTYLKEKNFFFYFLVKLINKVLNLIFIYEKKNKYLDFEFVYNIFIKFLNCLLDFFFTKDCLFRIKIFNYFNLYFNKNLNLITKLDKALFISIFNSTVFDILNMFLDDKFYSNISKYFIYCFLNIIKQNTQTTHTINIGTNKIKYLVSTKNTFLFKNLDSVFYLYFLNFLIKFKDFG